MDVGPNPYPTTQWSSNDDAMGTEMMAKGGVEMGIGAGGAGDFINGAAAAVVVALGVSCKKSSTGDEQKDMRKVWGGKMKNATATIQFDNTHRLHRNRHGIDALHEAKARSRRW